MPACFLPCITPATHTCHPGTRVLLTSGLCASSLPPLLPAPLPPLQVSSLLRRFNNLFGIPSRIHSLVAEGDLQQVWGARCGRGLLVAAREWPGTSFCDHSFLLVDSRCTSPLNSTQFRTDPPFACTTQIVREYHRANSLIKPSASTPRVWISLYQEIEKVGAPRCRLTRFLLACMLVGIDCPGPGQ